MPNKFPALRRRGLLVCAGVLAASALTAGLVPRASAAPLETVMLKDYQTGFCLQLWETGVYTSRVCDSANAAQSWELWAGAYDYTFQNEQVGTCLDSNYSDPSNPAVGAVYTSACDGDDTYQNWTPGGEGPGLTIQDYQTGLCLDSNVVTPPEGGGGAGEVYTDACNWNDTYQNWTVVAS